MVTSHKQSKWLLYYQGFLAVGVIFFFFTFIDSYIVVQQIASSPAGWMLPYFVLTIPLFILGKLKLPSPAILYWCIGYLLIVILSYLCFPTTEPSLRAFKDQSFSAVFLLITTCLFMDQQVQQWVRSALIAVTLMGVFNNLYQLVNPSTFFGLVDSRVSGFYMDPNDCAYALVLGMIFTVGMFPQKFRIPWILIVGLGIIITLSRGGMLCWIAAVLLLCWTRIIAYKHSGFWILSIGTLLLALVMSSSGDSLISLDLADERVLERVDGIINGDTLNDPSAVERIGILQKAWEMFLERPFLGYGIGSTSDYSITGFSVSTHNMFLLHAAEYGIIGLPILPLAIYASTRYASGETRKIGSVFTSVILLGSLFSHTVLDLRSYLVAFALIAAMSATSQSHPAGSSQVDSLRRKRGSVELSDSVVQR